MSDIEKETVATPFDNEIEVGGISNRTVVAAATSTALLLNANSNRLGCIIHNDSTAVLYLMFGSAGSVTDYTIQVASQTPYQFPPNTFKGSVYGVWSAANGQARITEFQ